MKLGSLGGLTAVIALFAAAPAVAGPSVTVRVEGAAGTLLERTHVTLPDTPPPVASCAAHTAGAAIDVATDGDWDRQAFTEQILGETHALADSDYWAEWLDRGDGYKRGGGICSDVLEEGDEVLMLVDRSPPPTFAPTVFPLALEGVPAQANRGDSITVTVVEYRSATGGTGEGERTPVAGATVTGGTATATTGADGRATLTLHQTGAIGLKAARTGNAPSATELVIVAERGFGPPLLPGGSRTVELDTVAPLARIAGIRDGQRFSRRRAPRELRGTVTEDRSGLRAVKLRLTRRVGDECWYFSGSRERFLRRRCGTRHAFKVGEEASWSYLLPARLGRGRYVLDVYAIDRAGNRDVVERGRSRVVFVVR
jgi:hypothetical protein